MKKLIVLVMISVVSFVAGFSVRSTGEANANYNQNLAPSPSPILCPKDEFPKLVEDKYITKFNGKRLSLEYGPDALIVDGPFAIDAAKITSLSDGGLLVNMGDALYRLDARQRKVWAYSTAQTIFDYAYVEATNLIYGTAGDNIMFIVDAATGKEKHSESRNGSAWYGVAQAYGDDMCLVTDNFRWYRENNWARNEEPMKDGITCWQGTKRLWHQAFPPDAELIVSGKRILAVTKSKEAIYVNEIVPPQSERE